MPSNNHSHNRPKTIITGASSGIGKACAERFALEGWDVCLIARRESLLSSIRETLSPGSHLVCPGAYEEPGTAENARSLIQKNWGVVDALINCAGVYMSAHATDSTIADWRRPFDIMFDGAVSMTRLAVPFMTRGGRIVHVTSIHGERVENLASAYAASKAAINQYCKSLALELASRNILVNAIAPGFIDTPMSFVNGVNELESEWFHKNYIEGHQEIAGVAYFLAGPDSTYITGQVITVDGGLTITF